MRRFLLPAILGVLLSACASAPIYQSFPQRTAIAVDGHASEWPQPLDYYNKDSKVSFSVSNDSSKIYFCIEAYDEQLQMKIVHGGIQLWIDTAGGNAQAIGVLYPVNSGYRPEGRESSQPRGYGSDSPDFDPIGTLRKEFLRTPSQIELKGFQPPFNGSVPQRNALGIEASINWDTATNVLCYEAAIPIRSFLNRSLVPLDSIKKLGLTFTVNGISRPRSQERAGESGGERGGGGGYPGGGAGMPGGGMGGMGGSGSMHGGGGGHRRGGGGGGGSTANPLAESESFWIKLQLAPVAQ
jgi:hypothetical protein